MDISGTNGGSSSEDKIKRFNSSRLEKIKDFIGNLDTPEDVNTLKLKFIFDLIDDHLIREYEQELDWLHSVEIERTCLNGINNRRSEMEILAVILKVCRRGVQKTKIIYKVNLSYSQLKNYITFLVETGLVKKEGKSKRGGKYITTSKGNLFLYHWTKILKLFDSEDTVMEEKLISELL